MPSALLDSSVSAQAYQLTLQRSLLIHHQSEKGPEAYEPYDHRSFDGEMLNRAGSCPEIVQQLSDMIDERLSP